MNPLYHRGIISFTMGKSQLEHNIAVHNKIAKRYEAIHGEIYNAHEQGRLKESLRQALLSVETHSSNLLALDFGCGAGNLTKHLTDLGADVLAADVSTGFLDLVASRVYERTVTTIQLNGTDLKGIEDASVDVVAMYSVLHHVPDYLALMKEFSRVLKPGGVIYIDHEVSARHWKEDTDYQAFLVDIKRKSKKDFKKYFLLSNYIDKYIRLFIDPKYQREGDIHVFQDDHIEWSKIRDELIAHKIEVLHEEDYLLYRRGYDEVTYNLWKNKVGDMHLLVGKKGMQE